MLSIDEIENMPFVFIVGKGRSGTTLLQTIFDSHPNVIVPFESRLIIHLKKKYFHITNWTTELVNEFITDLYTDKDFKNFWNVNKELLRQNINSYPLNSLTFAVICKIVYLSYPSPFPKTNIRLIGNKKPIYSLFLKEMLQIFPNCKFIHLIRDYRDNIISSKKALGQKNIAISAYRWIMHNEKIENFKSIYPQKFFTIKYEDLVSNPKKHIPDLCNFLSIPYNEGLYDFHYKTSDLYRKDKNENTLINNVMNKLHVNLMNPINTSQVDKWKNEMSIEEMELSDYIAGDFAKRYGYKKLTNKWSIKYFLASTKANIITKANNLTTILYFNLPTFIRKAIGSIIK